MPRLARALDRHQLAGSFARRARWLGDRAAGAPPELWIHAWRPRDLPYWTDAELFRAKRAKNAA